MLSSNISPKGGKVLLTVDFWLLVVDCLLLTLDCLPFGFCVNELR